LVLLKIFACVTVFSSVLFGSDWSAYLGPLRNGVSQDKNLLSSFPNEGPEILWRASMGVGWSAPVISDDLLYITSYEDNNKEVVLCLNAITGKEIWKYTYPVDYGKMEYSYGGPRASVTISANYACSIGAMGNMFCFDKLSGKIIWEKNLDKEYPPAKRAWKGWTISPLVEDGKVVVNLGPDEKKENERCAAFEMKTGNLKWLYKSPVKIVTTVQVSQTPQLAIFDNEKYLLYSPYARLTALKLSDGKPLFSYQLSEGNDTIATPVYVGGKLLEMPFGKEQIMLDIKKENGRYIVREVWKTKNSPSGHAGYQEWNGNLFGFASCFSLVCISSEKGQIMWSKYGFKQDSSLTVADGKIFIRNGKELIIAEAAGKVYRELSRISFKVESNSKDSMGWVAPLIVDGKMYLRFSRDLLCLKIR